MEATAASAPQPALPRSSERYPFWQQLASETAKVCYIYLLQLFYLCIVVAAGCIGYA